MPFHSAVLAPSRCLLRRQSCSRTMERHPYTVSWALYWKICCEIWADSDSTGCCAASFWRVQGKRIPTNIHFRWYFPFKQNLLNGARKKCKTSYLLTASLIMYTRVNYLKCFNPVELQTFKLLRHKKVSGFKNPKMKCVNIWFENIGNDGNQCFILLLLFPILSVM